MDGGGARARYRGLDRYRVQREWDRYEGNALRDLFRDLRTRFLERHRETEGRWSLDLGSGPGRFSPRIGSPCGTTVLVDLSREMLRTAAKALRRSPPGRFAFARGDARRLPFRPGFFAEVVVLGNLLGVAGASLPEVVAEVERTVAAGGRVLVEIVPGAGERSIYLGRLPPRTVRRLVRAPWTWLTTRIDTEGFRPARDPSGPSREFRRISVDEILGLFGPAWEAREIVAVAPALGFDPKRLEAMREDSASWTRLLDLEERIGRSPARWREAAAVLVALERRASPAAPDTPAQAGWLPEGEGFSTRSSASTTRAASSASRRASSVVGARATATPSRRSR